VAKNAVGSYSRHGRTRNDGGILLLPTEKNICLLMLHCFCCITKSKKRLKKVDDILCQEEGGSVERTLTRKGEDWGGRGRGEVRIPKWLFKLVGQREEFITQE
jgi:hypothetical protein